MDHRTASDAFQNARQFSLAVKGGEKMYRVGGSTGVFGLS